MMKSLVIFVTVVSAIIILSAPVTKAGMSQCLSTIIYALTRSDPLFHELRMHLQLDLQGLNLRDR